jgi:ribosomal protein S18 acetylase RimI-like enzyme
MNFQTKNFINLRAAQPEDTSKIAPLMIEAGNGLYEFLFEGFGPKSALVHIIEGVVSADKEPYGFRNCLIAEQDGQFAGFANAFPAKSVRDQDPGAIPQERWDHIAPLGEIMDWESFLLNSLGVLPSHRGQGVGDALIKGVLTEAKQLGFQNVTLQVWEGNEAARQLYERHGFAVVSTADLKSHSLLPGTRILLMRHKLAED